MAGLLVNAFVPDEWVDLRALVDDLVLDGTGLVRWDERHLDGGARLRSLAIARNDGGPTIDDVRTYALDAARARGFRVAFYEEAFKRTSLHDGTGNIVRIGQEPLPPRVILELHEPIATLDLVRFPGVTEMLALTAEAGASRVRELHRSAELDLETHDRFFPPSTSFSVRGPYDGVALCRALEGAGFVEDGDAWAREAGRLHAEIRLRDDVHVELVPTLLRSIF